MVNQRPWLAAGIAGATGGIIGFGSSLSSLMFTRGGVKSRVAEFEHPLRQRIIKTLEKNPGLHYRELQSKLSAANGTLRHHWMFYQAEKRSQLSRLMDEPATLLRAFSGRSPEGSWSRRNRGGKKDAYRIVTSSKDNCRRYPSKWHTKISSRTRKKNW